jgi:acetolactate synthase-1/2/3 large subunit
VSRSTVADVVVDGLKRAGTPRLFGVADLETNLPLLDAARRGGLPLTLASSATTAGIMAAVSGDLVEAPGAALVGSGRGVPPAIDGVAYALVDGAAMVLLTERLSVPGCKASLSVAAESAAHWIAHATRLAATEPRGPVHLEIPAEVARQPALPLATSCRPDPLPPPDRDALDGAARLLARVSRPLLVAGLHCRSTSVQQWVRALAEALPAPVLVTCRAKGALPDPHPLMLGVLGVDGVDERLLKRADLVVGLGLDALELVQSPWWSTVPVLGVGPPQALGDRIPAVAVVGDVAVVLEELALRLRDREQADWDVAELDRLKRERFAAGAGPALARRGIVRVAREATPAGTIATVDAGSHLVDVAIAWHAVAPREFLASNGCATAGFALPAAIAAHLVHPDRRIVCFTGTDGLAAAATELETATRLGAPIVAIVFGGSTSAAPDLMRLAQGFGVTAFAADSEARFGEALSRALRTAGPSLVAVWP